MAVCTCISTCTCTSISDIQAYVKIHLSEQILIKIQLTCFETWFYFQLQCFPILHVVEFTSSSSGRMENLEIQNRKRKRKREQKWKQNQTNKWMLQVGKYDWHQYSSSLLCIPCKKDDDSQSPFKKRHNYKEHTCSSDHSFHLNWVWDDALVMQNMFGFVLGCNKPMGNWLKCMCKKCLAARCIVFEKFAEAKRICAQQKQNII